MLLPLGHEQTTVRRLPWVTFTIMGLCLVAFLMTLLEGSPDGVIRDREIDALTYYFDHQYLELDPRLKGHAYFTLRQQYDDPPPPPADRVRLMSEQQELDRLVARMFEARDDSAYFRWGLIPADITTHAVISHMFMHAGWMHLLGNLFIFYLVGPFVEDVWGRLVFGGFFLVAGSVAGMSFALSHPGLDEPLIGASGAVAGVMGAFMVRYWRTRINFFYFFFFLKVYTGTFRAPAGLMLMLWFTREVLFMLGFWSFSPVLDGSDIAFAAHVVGFVFGVAVALAMRMARVEERFLDDAIEAKLTVFENVAAARAVDRARAGHSGEAIQQLRAELNRDPSNDDAAAALWNLCLSEGIPEQAVPVILPLVQRAIRRNDAEAVRPYWLELLRNTSGDALDLSSATRMAELLLDLGDLSAATETLIWAADHSTAWSPVGLQIRLARAADRLHLPEAHDLALSALGHPDLPPGEAPSLEKLTRH